MPMQARQQRTLCTVVRHVTLAPCTPLTAKISVSRCHRQHQPAGAAAGALRGAAEAEQRADSGVCQPQVQG